MSIHRVALMSASAQLGQCETMSSRILVVGSKVTYFTPRSLIDQCSSFIGGDMNTSTMDGLYLYRSNIRLTKYDRQSGDQVLPSASDSNGHLGTMSLSCCARNRHA